MLDDAERSISGKGVVVQQLAEIIGAGLQIEPTISVFWRIA